MGGVLEQETDTVNGLFLGGVRDGFRGGQNTDCAHCRLFAQSGVHMAAFGPGQPFAVHIQGSSLHGYPGHHVLAHRLYQEVLGGDDPHPGFSGLFRVDDPGHPGKMVDMTMGEDDGGNRLFPQVFYGKVKGFLRGFS